MSDGTRERLDLLLVRRGLAPTRTRAQALILAGRVYSAGRRLSKPGERLPQSLPLEVREGPRWVSRGGDKLAGVLERLAVQAVGREALDVGASTGGFTHVLLAAGARRVVALDVGRGQLDWSLRNDARVVPLEGINARYLLPQVLPCVPSLAVVDVSFISLTRVLEPVAACLDEQGDIVALVKPQFEVGRGHVGRGGIVRDPALWREVLERLTAWCDARRLGPTGLVTAARLGAAGNQEFFLHLRPARPSAPLAEAIDAALAEALAARQGGR